MCERDFAKRTVLQCASVRVRSGKANKTAADTSAVCIDFKIKHKPGARNTKRRKRKIVIMRINTMSHMKIIILLFLLCSSPSLGNFPRLYFASFHFIWAGGKQIGKRMSSAENKSCKNNNKKKETVFLCSPRFDVRMTTQK